MCLVLIRRTKLNDVYNADL